MSHLYCVECTAPTYTYRYESFVLCWLYSPNIYTQIWVICIVLSVLPQHIHTDMSHLYCIDCTAPTYTYKYESFVLCWVYCPNIYIQIWVICIVLAVLPQHIHTNMSHLYCIDSTVLNIYIHIWVICIVLTHICMYMLPQYTQYDTNMSHICMYVLGQYCLNLYIHIWVILTVLPQHIHIRTDMSHLYCVDSYMPQCICWGSTLNTIQMTHICMYMLGLWQSTAIQMTAYLYVYVGTVYIYIYIYIYIYAWLNCPNIYIYT